VHNMFIIIIILYNIGMYSNFEHLRDGHASLYIKQGARAVLSNIVAVKKYLQGDFYD